MTRARDVADKNLAVISAGNSGQILTSDGTNWSAQNSPVELPAHGTNGNVLTSDGSQWTSATPATVDTDLVNDMSPQLGGDLDMQSHSISNGVLGVKNTGTQSELRLYCEVGNAHYVGLKAPAHSAFSGNHSITMPPNTGNNGEFLQTDGNGVTSWASAGGGAGWTWLAKNDITSSTSYSTFDSTKVTNSYTNYAVVMNHVNWGGSSEKLAAFFHVNNAWRQGTGSEDYQFQMISYHPNVSGNAIGTSSGVNNWLSYIRIVPNNSGSSASQLSTSLVFYFNTRANGGLFRNFHWQGTSTTGNQGAEALIGAGQYRGETSYDITGIRFYGQNGASFSRGEFNLYGLAGS